jgi:Cu/Ag efflux pump CusA
MSRVGARVTEELRSVEGVSGVGSHFGRAVTSDTHSSANGGMLWLTIAEDADYDRTVEAVQEVVAGYPGLEREVLTYSTERVSQYTTGSSSPVTVRLYGEDMATLREQATKVHALLGSVDGVANPVIASQAQEPTIQIDVDLVKAREHGVKPGDVRRAATTLLSGIHVGSLFDQQKVFDVQVWSAPEVRENVSDVSNLVLDTPGGKHIKLSDVATVSVAPSPTSISHDGVSRRIDVTADVSGRSLNAVLGDVKGALKNVAFPMEYHAEVLGDYVEQKNAERGAMVLGAFALLVVFLLLQSAFESWRLAAVTLLTLPLCLLGGLVAARLTGAELTLATVAGLLAILALAVRASLRLVTRARELTGHSSTSDAYAAASAEHAMPVVVTAAVAAAALLPVLVLGPRAGLESLQPFAVVVLGGLVTTVLTVMLVLPALCGRYATRANQEAASAPLPPTSPAVGRG